MFFNLPSFAVGFGLGFGSGYLTRSVVGAGASASRNATKAAIRGSLQAVETTRNTFAHIGESLEDLVAEVKAEMTPMTVEAQEADEAKGKAKAQQQPKKKVKES